MATPPIGALIVAGALALTTLAGRLDKRDAAKPAATLKQAEPVSSLN
jgi:hypothetical protein